MKRNIYANRDINILELEPSVSKILYDNNINTIGLLWELSKKQLKEYGIMDSDIRYISIKMQLLGLDLNKKVYKI